PRSSRLSLALTWTGGGYAFSATIAERGGTGGGNLRARRASACLPPRLALPRLGGGRDSLGGPAAHRAGSGRGARERRRASRLHGAPPRPARPSRHRLRRLGTLGF